MNPPEIEKVCSAHTEFGRPSTESDVYNYCAREIWFYMRYVAYLLLYACIRDDPSLAELENKISDILKIPIPSQESITVPNGICHIMQNLNKMMQCMAQAMCEAMLFDPLSTGDRLCQLSMQGEYEMLLRTVLESGSKRALLYRDFPVTHIERMCSFSITIFLGKHSSMQIECMNKCVRMEYPIVDPQGQPTDQRQELFVSILDAYIYSGIRAWAASLNWSFVKNCFVNMLCNIDVPARSGKKYNPGKIWNDIIPIWRNFLTMNPQDLLQCLLGSGDFLSPGGVIWQFIEAVRLPLDLNIPQIVVVPPTAENIAASGAAQQMPAVTQSYALPLRPAQKFSFPPENS